MRKMIDLCNLPKLHQYWPIETLSNGTRLTGESLSVSGEKATRIAAAITHPNATSLDGVALCKGVDAWSLNHTEKLTLTQISTFAANTIAQFSMTALAAADQGIDFLPMKRFLAATIYALFFAKAVTVGSSSLLTFSRTSHQS